MGIALSAIIYNSSAAQRKLDSNSPDTENNLAINSTQTDLRPLKIGDMVPDIEFSNVLNYKAKKLRLSNFRGKLIILDFWSTYCSSCIRLFPKMEELQKKYKDNLVIITVGFNVMNNDEIENFLNKGKSHFQLPTIVQEKSEKQILNLFPHESVPHEIWISPEGILVGITDASAVSENNIQSIIDKKISTLPVKSSARNVSWNSQFLLGKNLQLNQVSSAFSPYIDSFKVSSNPFGLQHDSSFWRLYDVNSTVLSLYQNAYAQKIKGLNKKRIIINSDTFLFQEYSNLKNPDNWQLDQFRKNNLFCYELILPKHFEESQLYDRMILDLDWYFKFKSKIEKRKIKCLSLVELDSPHTASKKSPVLDTSNFINNINTSIFVKVLDSQRTGDNRPIIDGTKKNKTLSVQLPEEGFRMLENLSKTRTILRTAGFDLIETDTELEVVVIYSHKK